MATRRSNRSSSSAAFASGIPPLPAESSDEDEDEYEAQEVAGEDDEAAPLDADAVNLSSLSIESTKSERSQRGEYEKLPSFLQKQVVRDILEVGGIETVTYGKLNEYSPDTYAFKSTNQRKIEQKLTYWKGNSQSAGRKQFNSLCTEVLQGQGKPPPPSPFSPKPSSDNPSTARRAREPRNYRETKPATSSTMSAILKEAQESVPYPIRTQVVDVKHPENNSPFVVFLFTDDEVGLFMYDGYQIVFQDVDVRWMMTDHPMFTAHHLGGGKVLVKFPSTSWTHLHAATAEGAGKEAAGKLNSRVLQQEKQNRTALRKDAEDHEDRGRQFTYKILEFPEGLQNDIYTSNSDKNGLIESFLVPVGSDIKLTVDDMEHEDAVLRVNIIWDIGIAGSGRQIELEDKKKSTNPLKAQMEDFVRSSRTSS